MVILSWQTSLLMNATGNFKKKIKPSDLYKSINTKGNFQELKKNTKSKKELQAELLEVFADSI